MCPSLSYKLTPNAIGVQCGENPHPSEVIDNESLLAPLQILAHARNRSFASVDEQTSIFQWWSRKPALRRTLVLFPLPNENVRVFNYQFLSKKSPKFCSFYQRQNRQKVEFIWNKMNILFRSVFAGRCTQTGWKFAFEKVATITAILVWKTL